MEATPKEKFKVFPSPPARIKDVTEGIYDMTEKELTTIYGKLKRVQLVATIIGKQYTPASQGDRGEKKSRFQVVLDDGTGIAKVTWFGPTEEAASEYDVGDIVVVVARAGEYGNEITFSADAMRKLPNLTEELYHRALVVKKLKALKKAGKDLVLKNGGLITNRPDEASKFFTGKPAFDDNIEAIEEPVDVSKGGDDKLQFVTRINEEKEGDADAPAGFPVKVKNAVEGKPSSRGAIDGGDDEGLDNEDDFIKDTIMETIMQAEHAEGITVKQLQEVTQIDQKQIARVLKIMVTERIITQEGGLYKPT
jgi:hypothetical protein